MPKFYHVGLNFSGPPKIKELEGAFSAAGDWLRYSANCWIIWTNRSAQEIFNILKPYLVDQDQFLIAEINMFERNGWLPEWIWNWINARQVNALTGVAGLGSALAGANPFSGLAPYNPLDPFNPYDPNKK